MIRTGFFAIQDAAKGKARPKDQPKVRNRINLVYLGAGMMGAGIAYVSAKAGMSVVLKDVSLEGAEKGKGVFYHRFARQSHCQKALYPS